MKNANINESLKPIFEEYGKKLQDPTYEPSTPIETLFARLTAVWLCESDDLELVERAKLFIFNTSVDSSELHPHLSDYSSEITSWDELKIFSVYSNYSGSFVEYQLRTTTLENIEKIVHYHAMFSMDNDRCQFVSEFPPMIRVIGDPVLHRPGSLFPIDPTQEEQQELVRQIECAKSVLIKTSGAGIAANQCSGITDPYRFTIVGIFDDIPEHVAGVARRYPGTLFPSAKIMVNPVIISFSEETQNFNHACLSVPTPNKCCIKSPDEITVAYRDAAQDMANVTLTMKGIDAVVLWHELNHILDGKTYIDTAFESLAPDDLNVVKDMLIAEKERREMSAIRPSGIEDTIPQLTVPPFHFTVKMNSENIPTVDRAEIAAVLLKMTTETIDGLITRCKLLASEAGPAYRGMERA